MSDGTNVRLEGVLRWPTPTARAWTAQFLDRAPDDPNVLAIVAVGSSVRPGVPSDDLDLVVLCVDCSQFGYDVPMEIDAWTVATESAEGRLTKGHPLLGWAVQLGVPLYDRAGAWQSIVESWRGRVPLPDPVLARQRAEKMCATLRIMEEVGDEGAAVEYTLSYVTLLARASLAEHGVFPASRPELPDQLEKVGEFDLAARLRQALVRRAEILREAS